MISAEILRIVEEIVIALFLIYAAYSDYKTRIIEDKVWGLMLLVLAPVTLYLLFSAYEYLIATYIASLVVSIMLGIFVGLTKLTGGADVKAIMVMGAIVIPRGLNPLLIPSLTIVLNGVVFSLLTIAYVMFRNISMYIKFGKLFEEELPLTTKIVLLFTAYKERVSNVASHPHKYFIVELREQGSKRYRLALLSVEEETSEVIKNLLSQGVKESDWLWVSPSIPLIVYILLGYIYYISIGNILEPLLRFLIKVT